MLSTLCVCGCLWADVLREGSELTEAVRQLLGQVADEKDRREAAEAQVAALQAEVERSASATQDAPAPLPTHGACPLCGYWDADQRKVAGHIRQCQRRSARSRSLEETREAGEG